MARQLTEAQWRWIESDRSTFKKIRNNTIWHAVIISIASFILWSFYWTDAAWAKNIAVGLSILYFFWLCFACVVMTAAMISLAAEKNKKKAKFETAVMIKPLIYRRNTFGGYLRRTERIYSLIVEYGTITATIAYGWVFWGIILLLLNVLSDLLCFSARQLCTEFIADLSPSDLQKYAGQKDSFICGEIITNLRNAVKVGETETKVEKGGSKTQIALKEAPQSRLVLQITETTLKLAELIYGQTETHLEVDLSEPGSIENIEEKMVEVATRRVREAKE